MTMCTVYSFEYDQKNNNNKDKSIYLYYMTKQKLIVREIISTKQKKEEEKCVGSNFFYRSQNYLDSNFHFLVTDIKWQSVSMALSAFLNERYKMNYIICKSSNFLLDIATEQIICELLLNVKEIHLIVKDFQEEKQMLLVIWNQFIHS